MYRYYECISCKSRMAIPVVSGATAVPVCSKAGCGRPTVKIGEGDGPLAPPPSPAVSPAAPLSASEVVVYQDTGTHQRRGQVDYLVTRNAAEMRVTVAVTIPARQSPYVVCLASGLLSGGGAEARLTAPVGGTWHQIQPGTLPPSMVISNPPTLDPTIRFGVKLGNPAFGLIHVIAGHHDDLRTLTGTGEGVANVTVTAPAVGPGMSWQQADRERARLQAEMESYRSYLAIQAGLKVGLSNANLQAIYRHRQEATKWIFVGLAGAKPMIVVCRKEGGLYDITTMYIGNAAEQVTAVAGTGTPAPAWKRSKAQLPRGW